MTAARETQAIPSLALQIKPTHGGYQPNRFEPNPYIGLACTLGYNFFKGLARSYVQPIGPNPLPLSVRCSGASNEY